MQFDLEIGNRVSRVRVDGRGDRLTVTVDGRRFDVDARLVSAEAVSLLLRDGDGPVRSVDAGVVARPSGGGFEVSLGGRVLVATPLSPFGRRGGDGGVRGAGPQQVIAPMPGRVVRVLVARGDEVAPRQGLVVIEAMKMENELRAARAGRIGAVHVAEGQSVEAGALLVTVE